MAAPGRPSSTNQNTAPPPESLRFSAGDSIADSRTLGRVSWLTSRLTRRASCSRPRAASGQRPFYRQHFIAQHAPRQQGLEQHCKRGAASHQGALLQLALQPTRPTRLRHRPRCTTRAHPARKNGVFVRGAGGPRSAVQCAARPAQVAPIHTTGCRRSGGSPRYQSSSRGQTQGQRAPSAHARPGVPPALSQLPAMPLPPPFMRHAVRAHAPTVAPTTQNTPATPMTAPAVPNSMGMTTLDALMAMSRRPRASPWRCSA